MRKFRFIKPGYGVHSLSKHEREELRIDFDIDVKGFYVITSLTRREWEAILAGNVVGQNFRIKEASNE